MMTVWKYPFDVTDRFDLEMPHGVQMLSVQVQDGVPCLWALVDDENTKVTVRFRVVGTGNPAPDMYIFRTFVGTFQLEGGALVFHLFASRP